MPDVVGFLNAAVELDYATTPIWLADAAHDSDCLDQSRAASSLWPNVRGTAPAVPSGDIYDFFASSYRSEYEGDDAAASSYTSYAYDAAWLALYGTAWSLASEGAITGLGAARRRPVGRHRRHLGHRDRTATAARREPRRQPATRRRRRRRRDRAGIRPVGQRAPRSSSAHPGTAALAQLVRPSTANAIVDRLRRHRRARRHPPRAARTRCRPRPDGPLGPAAGGLGRRGRCCPACWRRRCCRGGTA